MSTRHLLLLSLLCHTCVQAYPSVSLQRSLFDTAPMVTSNGTTLDASFTFELGTFGSFTPTQSNLDQWDSSWKLLNLGTWSPGTQEFGNLFSFNPDGTVNGLAGSATFTTGEQAYLWVRSGNEWALVTDNVAGPDGVWTLPNPALDPGSSSNWVLDSAIPIIGGANGIQSGTPFSVDPGPGFRLQTTAIPEPGSALFIASIGLSLMLKRKALRATADHGRY